MKGKNLPRAESTEAAERFHWFRRQSSQLAQMSGFYTTRFVIAGSEMEAVELDLKGVETEISQLVPTCLWQFEVIEMWREEERLPDEGGGQGFTWYQS